MTRKKYHQYSFLCLKFYTFQNVYLDVFSFPFLVPPGEESNFVSSKTLRFQSIVLLLPLYQQLQYAFLHESIFKSRRKRWFIYMNIEKSSLCNGCITISIMGEFEVSHKTRVTSNEVIKGINMPVFVHLLRHVYEFNCSIHFVIRK